MSKELRELAMAATKGPWEAEGDEEMEKDVRYIAACSPDVVLGLLDRLDRQERVMREALAAFNRIAYIECDKLSHHGKDEFHAPHEVCPVVGSVNDAIAAIERELTQ